MYQWKEPSGYPIQGRTICSLEVLGLGGKRATNKCGSFQMRQPSPGLWKSNSISLLGDVGMWKTSYTNKTMVFPELALYEWKPVTSIPIAVTFLLVQRTTISGDAASDFNARSLGEWRTPGVKSSPQAWLDIVLANVKCMSTFWGRGLGSIIDLINFTAMDSDGLQVNENYILSGRQTIIFDIENGESDSERHNSGQQTRIINWDFLEGACDATIPWRCFHHNKKPNY